MSGSKWVVKVMLTMAVVDIIGSHGQQSLRGVMKVWRENTNFGNARNWEGLVDENCSENIFSFPGWMETKVVALPSQFIGKQILLVNGHFVFQPGLTTFSDSGTCQHGREVKFRRTNRADWFDPKNWLLNDTSGSASGGRVVNNQAIPHVERIPCQYDVVKFPSRSTFHLVIPQKVSIGKFFLGEEEQSYTDIAVMMNSELGKLQFQKSPDVEFTLTKTSCNDNADCVCSNYENSSKQKICSLASECTNVAMECPNPIVIHGFCCPICGFHVRISHNGELKLNPLEDKLKKIESGGNGGVWDADVYISRYQVKGAHIIVIPLRNGTHPRNIRDGVNYLKNIIKFIQSLPEVEEVTWSGSWESVSPDADKLEEGHSGMITFIVLLLLSLLTIVIICFIYRNKTQYPPLSFARIGDFIPRFSTSNIRMPTMQMPTANMSFPFRRGSTQAGGRTFGFARFSNDRISTINIERSGGSTLERGEAVDETINPIDVPSEKVTDASSQNSGVAQVVECDILGSDATTDGLAGNPLGIPPTLDEFISTSSANQEGGNSVILVDFDTEPNPTVATSGFQEEKVIGQQEKVKAQILGPAKPNRTKVDINAKEDEPIYNQVYDAFVDDDTSAILPTKCFKEE